MASDALLTAYKAAVEAHKGGDLGVALTKYRQALAIKPVPAILNNVAGARARGVVRCLLRRLTFD